MNLLPAIQSSRPAYTARCDYRKTKWPEYRNRCLRATGFSQRNWALSLLNQSSLSILHTRSTKRWSWSWSTRSPRHRLCLWKRNFQRYQKPSTGTKPQPKTETSMPWKNWVPFMQKVISESKRTYKKRNDGTTWPEKRNKRNNPYLFINSRKYSGCFYSRNIADRSLKNRYK